MSELDDLTFSLAENSPVQRCAFRALVRGLQVRIALDEDVDAPAAAPGDLAALAPLAVLAPRRYDLFELHDISAAGFSLNAPLHAYAVGHMLHLDLLAGNKVLLAGLEAQIVRRSPNELVACAFVRMTRHQEIKLDKLMLEIQKRKIAQRKIFDKQRDEQGETSGE